MCIEMIETNAARVFSQFQNLTHKELGKALKSGLKKALKVIQKDAKKILVVHLRIQTRGIQSIPILYRKV